MESCRPLAVTELSLSATRPGTRINTVKYTEFQVSAFLHVVCGRFFLDEIFF